MVGLSPLHFNHVMEQFGIHGQTVSDNNYTSFLLRNFGFNSCHNWLKLTKRLCICGLFIDFDDDFVVIISSHLRERE